jgi:hypothetical protein
MRGQIADSRGYKTWRDYERGDPTGAVHERTTICDHVLQILQFAVDELASVGAAVEQPVTADAQGSAKKLRKAHRALLQKYPDIDSMDALHITFGNFMKCEHFVSFDNAWADISEIQLLH